MTMPPPPLPGKQPRHPKPPKAPKVDGPPRSVGSAGSVGSVGSAGVPTAKEPKPVRGAEPLWGPAAPRPPKAARGPKPPGEPKVVDPDAPSLITRLDDAKLRSRIAMVVGALSIPLAIIFTGVSVYGAADGSGVEGITVSSTSAGPLPAAGSDPLPSGDYTQICAQLQANKGAFSATADLRTVSQQLLTVDIPGLVAVAPEGIRPALTNLEQSRAKAAEVLSTPADGTVTQAQREALPPDYLPSLVSLSLMVDEKCA